MSAPTILPTDEPEPRFYVALDHDGKPTLWDGGHLHPRGCLWRGPEWWYAGCHALARTAAELREMAEAIEAWERAQS